MLLFQRPQNLHSSSHLQSICTARRYLSAVYAVVVYLCVRVCHIPVLYQNG